MRALPRALAPSGDRRWSMPADDTAHPLDVPVIPAADALEAERLDRV
jgi:hypothetical protein